MDSSVVHWCYCGSMGCYLEHGFGMWLNVMCVSSCLLLAHGQSRKRDPWYLLYQSTRARSLWPTTPLGQLTVTGWSRRLDLTKARSQLDEKLKSDLGLKVICSQIEPLFLTAEYALCRDVPQTIQINQVLRLETESWWPVVALVPRAFTLDKVESSYCTELSSHSIHPFGRRVSIRETNSRYTLFQMVN